MAEDAKIFLDGSATDLGNIQVAPQVLEIIAGVAMNEVKGVINKHGLIASNVNQMFGRSDYAHGVRLADSEDGLLIEISVLLDYGVSVPKVALEIQKRVKQQVKLMTDLTISEVDVHIEGIVPEKATSKFDPNNIFGENTGDYS